MKKKILLATFLFILGITFTAYAGGDAGYKKGFYIKTDDGRFLLNIGVSAQFRWTYYTPDIGEDTSEFMMRRLRPCFSGYMWHPDLQFKFEWETRTDTHLTDAYFNYITYQYASIQGGQFYVPFNREQLTEPWYLQFVDRSIVNDFFTMGRDIGLMLHKQFSDGKFEYAFGVFNGNGPNHLANDNNDYLYALRVGLYPNGYMKYSQCSMEDPDEVMFGVGAGVTINKVPAGEAEAMYENDIVSATGDLVLKYRGFSFETAYYYRNIDPDTSDVTDYDSQGFLVQAGYMFVPEKFELAVRYGFIDPNKDIDDLRDSEFTAGWNYFFRMHNVKMQMDYSYLLTQAPDEDDVQDNRVRLQFQYKF